MDCVVIGLGLSEDEANRGLSAEQFDCDNVRLVRHAAIPRGQCWAGQARQGNPLRRTLGAVCLAACLRLREAHENSSGRRCFSSPTLFALALLQLPRHYESWIAPAPATTELRSNPAERKEKFLSQATARAGPAGWGIEARVAPLFEDASQLTEISADTDEKRRWEGQQGAGPWSPASTLACLTDILTRLYMLAAARRR